MSDSERRDESASGILDETKVPTVSTVYGPTMLARTPKPHLRFGTYSVATGDVSSMSYVQTNSVDALSQADLHELARDSATLLFRYVEERMLRPAQLTFAAELLGSTADMDRSESLLMSLTSHNSALVREGAVYGLQRLLSPAAKARLRILSESDASPGVREAAAEALGRRKAPR